MPFPKNKIHFIKSFGSSPRVKTVEDPETGVTTEIVEDCNKKLPSAELFEIQNQLKAGVTLNEVNTKILGSGIKTEDLTEAIKTTTKSTKSTKSDEEE